MKKSLTPKTNDQTPRCTVKQILLSFRLEKVFNLLFFFPSVPERTMFECLKTEKEWHVNYTCIFTLPKALPRVFVSLAAFTLLQKLARLNRAGLGPDLAHFSGTVYIATKTSSVDPSPVRGARLYVLSFYSSLVE